MSLQWGFYSCNKFSSISCLQHIQQTDLSCYCVFIIAFYFRPDLFVRIPAWRRSHALPCFEQSCSPCAVALSGASVSSGCSLPRRHWRSPRHICSVVPGGHEPNWHCTAPPPPLLHPRDKSAAPEASLEHRVGEQAPGEEAWLDGDWLPNHLRGTKCSWPLAHSQHQLHLEWREMKQVSMHGLH